MMYRFVTDFYPVESLHKITMVIHKNSDKLGMIVTENESGEILGALVDTWSIRSVRSKFPKDNVTEIAKEYAYDWNSILKPVYGKGGAPLIYNLKVTAIGLEIEDISF